MTETSWRTAARWILLGLTLVLVAAAPVSASRCENPETVTFLAGAVDNFALPAEPTAPSAELAAFLPGVPQRNFDAAGTDLHLKHTFSGLPTGICGARLTVSACVAGGGSGNDAVLLELTGGQNFAWGQFFSTLSGLAWTGSDCAVLSYELDALPAGFGNNTNILEALNDGDLDLYVQDDTSIDYARLEVRNCPPVECVPPPRGLTAWFPLDEAAGGVAHELVAKADGAWVNGPVPVVPGRIDNALSFASGSHVSAPDHPAFDFGAGEDFSVDFWIRTTDTRVVSPVLEKRALEPNEKGWTVFLIGGQLALQLAEGGSGFCDSVTPDGCTNYGSGVSVADGAWHFVAITVNRDVADGIHWYLDGAEVGTRRDPTLRADSLENAGPLRIGVHAFNANNFAGDLDEVEIFRRVLSAGEIQRLFASPSGKCKAHLTQPWDIYFCANAGTTQTKPAICNDSTEPRSFGVHFQGLVNSPGCNSPGPTGFTLAEAQPILVAPGTCRTLNLTIQKPAGLNANNDPACFETTVEDLGSGQVYERKSALWDTGQLCFPDRNPSRGVPLDRRVPVSFEVQNRANTARTLNFEIGSMSSDPEVDFVRLNGGQAGGVVTGQASLPAGRTTPISVDVELADSLPFEQQDLMLTDRDSGTILTAKTLSSFSQGCTAEATTLCLGGGRFRVNAVWRTPSGNSGVAQAVSLTGDTGYFWFFQPDNVELVLKVLDGTPINDNYWVFYGALSNVEYTITVTDTVAGTTTSYTNPSGRLASVADTGALPGIDPLPASASLDAAVEPEAISLPEVGEAPALTSAWLAPRGTCTAGPRTLCLNDGRFRVEVDWQIPSGATGPGTAVQLTADTGYFWFFSSANVELVLKVLDGTGVNGHYWVFYGALSDVRYTLTVTDTVTGRSKTYTNPQGNLASVADTGALPQ